MIWIEAVDGVPVEKLTSEELEKDYQEEVKRVDIDLRKLFAEWREK